MNFKLLWRDPPPSILSNPPLVQLPAEWHYLILSEVIPAFDHFFKITWLINQSNDANFAALPADFDGQQDTRGWSIPFIASLPNDCYITPLGTVHSTNPYQHFHPWDHYVTYPKIYTFLISQYRQQNRNKFNDHITLKFQVSFNSSVYIN